MTRSMPREWPALALYNGFVRRASGRRLNSYRLSMLEAVVLGVLARLGVVGVKVDMLKVLLWRRYAERSSLMRSGFSEGWVPLPT